MCVCCVFVCMFVYDIELRSGTGVVAARILCNASWWDSRAVNRKRQLRYTSRAFTKLQSDDRRKGARDGDFELFTPSRAHLWVSS